MNTMSVVILNHWQLQDPLSDVTDRQIRGRKSYMLSISGCKIITIRRGVHCPSPPLCYSHRSVLCWPIGLKEILPRQATGLRFSCIYSRSVLHLEPHRTNQEFNSYPLYSFRSHNTTSGKDIQSPHKDCKHVCQC